MTVLNCQEQDVCGIIERDGLICQNSSSKVLQIVSFLKLSSPKNCAKILKIAYAEPYCKKEQSVDCKSIKSRPWPMIRKYFHSIQYTNTTEIRYFNLQSRFFLRRRLSGKES